MRTKYLQELIHFINWKDAAHSLEEFPWDNWVDLVTLKVLDIENILLKYLKWSVAEDEVVAWAEFLEMRDDIGYESDVVKQILIQVANPDLYWILNKEKVIEYMELLWLPPHFPL